MKFEEVKIVRGKTAAAVRQRGHPTANDDLSPDARPSGVLNPFAPVLSTKRFRVHLGRA